MLLPSKYGIHTANGGDTLVEDALYLNVSHVTLLDLQAQCAKALHDAIDGYLHLRFYLTNWYTVDPVYWARKCASRATQDRGGWTLLSLPRVIFSPSNEMNLPFEGGGWTEEWYIEINRWLLAWVREFRRLTGCSKERLMWSSLAPGHEEDVYGYDLCQESLAEFGMLGAHIYWFSRDQVSSEYYGRRYLSIHEDVPNLPLFIAEAGNFAITRDTTIQEFLEWFEELYNYPWVIGATPFIRSDPTGAHQSNDWSRNQNLVQTIHALVKKPTEIFTNEEGSKGDVTMPDDRPLSEQFPDEYDAWVNAGGIENNFRAHLLGTGVIDPSADDLRMLTSNAKSAAEQAQNAVANYPF